MKLKYESPRMMVELFSVNNAIAACEEKAAAFSCLKGPNIDQYDNVITDSCGTKAMTSTYTDAYFAGLGKTYSLTSGSVKGQVYSAPKGSTGLIALCVALNNPNNNTTSHWTENTVNKRIEHEKNCTISGARNTHVQVAPLVGDPNTVLVGS